MLLVLIGPGDRPGARSRDDLEHQKVLDQLDQELWYQSNEDYAKYARETFQKERTTIERLGLLAK